MGFSGPAHRFALRLPEGRHPRREAEPAFVAVQNLAAARVFEAMHRQKRFLDTLLSLGADRLLRHPPRPAEGKAGALEAALYGVPADRDVFILRQRLVRFVRRTLSFSKCDTEYWLSRHTRDARVMPAPVSA